MPHASACLQLFSRHSSDLLVVQGHDHILQHTKRGDVHYFGSGAGAMKHTGINLKYEGLLGVHEGHYGFVSR